VGCNTHILSDRRLFTRTRRIRRGSGFVQSEPRRKRNPSRVTADSRWYEMDVEDGVIWVYGIGDDGVLAFTDFGIENLIELIKIHKDDPSLLRRLVDLK
jgi:hypothetical protein